MQARCQGTGFNPTSSRCNPTVLTKWADEMSTYVKSIDGNHLVSFGTEGYFNRSDTTATGSYQYDGYTGQDYDAEIRLPHIDFGTIHLYPEFTAEDDLPWTERFLADHEASSVAARKPALLEEYGISRYSGRFNRSQVYARWHDAVFNSSTINGDLTWASLQFLGGCPAGDEWAICPADADFAADTVDWIARMNRKFPA